MQDSLLSTTQRCLTTFIETGRVHHKGTSYISSFLSFSLSFAFLGPAAYGNSQARGWIGAAAASLRYSHSNARSKLHHSSQQQCWIPNPLREAGDQTRILMNTSQVRYHWAAMGTPLHIFRIKCFQRIFLRVEGVCSDCLWDEIWVRISHGAQQVKDLSSLYWLRLFL